MNKRMFGYIDYSNTPAECVSELRELVWYRDSIRLQEVHTKIIWRQSDITLVELPNHMIEQYDLMVMGLNKHGGYRRGRCAIQL